MPDKSLQIPTADGQADAFAAFPGNGGQHPGVLLYPDAFGVRPVLQQMARELAGRLLLKPRRQRNVRHGTVRAIPRPGRTAVPAEPRPDKKLTTVTERNYRSQRRTRAASYAKKPQLDRSRPASGKSALRPACP